MMRRRRQQHSYLVFGLLPEFITIVAAIDAADAEATEFSISDNTNNVWSPIPAVKDARQLKFRRQKFFFNPSPLIIQIQIVVQIACQRHNDLLTQFQGKKNAVKYAWEMRANRCDTSWFHPRRRPTCFFFFTQSLIVSSLSHHTFAFSTSCHYYYSPIKNEPTHIVVLSSHMTTPQVPSNFFSP